MLNTDYDHFPNIKILFIQLNPKHLIANQAFQILAYNFLLIIQHSEISTKKGISKKLLKNLNEHSINQNQKYTGNEY